MNQNQRDKRAIRTILNQMGEATYPDIALRGGEGLASPLMEMVRDGEVAFRQREAEGRLPAGRVFYLTGDQE